MTRAHWTSILILTTALASGCADRQASSPNGPAVAGTPEEASAYHAEVEAWQRERDARLAEPDSWLTLAGLFWFQPGENVAGSDLQYDIPLPESVPARLGTFYYRPEATEGEKVELVVDEGLTVTVGDEAVSRTFLRLDAEGDPTVAHLDAVSFFAIQRGEQVGLRVRDRDSVTRQQFTGVPRYPVDARWRIPARFEPYDPPKSIQVPTVLGTSFDSPSPGRLVFEHEGQSYALDALPGGDDHGVWVIFADASNADTTYGSGRFLDVEVPAGTSAGSSETVIDFNIAYNPPCAFTPFATCPLPPADNKLALRVDAGEKRFSGTVH